METILSRLDFYEKLVYPIHRGINGSAGRSTTRPDSIEGDPSTRWVRLKIIDAERRPDQVEFIATFKLNGKAHRMHENSRFIYENGSYPI